MESGWKALGERDYEAVRRITDECVGRYAQRAVQYNEGCGANEIPPENDCALLNDVAQCWAIRSLSYSRTKEFGKLEGVCQELHKNYSSSFVYDPHGWQWTALELCDSLLEDIQKSNQNQLKK